MTIHELRKRFEEVTFKPDGIPFNHAEYEIGHCPILTIYAGEDGFVEIEFPKADWSVYFDAPRNIDELLEKLDDVSYKAMKKLMSKHDEVLVQKGLLSFREVYLLAEDKDGNCIEWVLGPYQMPMQDAMDTLSQISETPKLKPYDFYMYTNILIENTKELCFSVHTIMWKTHGTKDKPEAVITFDRGFLYKVSFGEDPDWLAAKIRDSLVSAAKRIHSVYRSLHSLSVVRLFAERHVGVYTDS